MLVALRFFTGMMSSVTESIIHLTVAHVNSPAKIGGAVFVGPPPAGILWPPSRAQLYTEYQGIAIGLVEPPAGELHLGGNTMRNKRVIVRRSTKTVKVPVKISVKRTVTVTKRTVR